jgi:putative transposase
LNKEIRRRTDVVSIFPDRASIIRLVGSLLIEQTEEWAEQRHYMSLEALERGPTGKVPRRRPRHEKRPPGVADGRGSRADHAEVNTPLLRT